MSQQKLPTIVPRGSPIPSTSKAAEPINRVKRAREITPEQDYNTAINFTDKSITKIDLQSNNDNKKDSQLNNDNEKFNLSSLVQKINNSKYLYPILCMLSISIIVCVAIVSLCGPIFIKLLIVLIYISLLVLTVYWHKK